MRGLPALALFLLLPMPPPQPIYTLQSTGDPVVFLVPAFDPSQGPEQAISTQVTVDLEFDYTVQNFTGQQAYVLLCGPGSSQTVELTLEDGTGVGNVVFPLMPVGLLLQPGATEGPSAVVVKNVPAIWQTHLGNLPATEGPPGSEIKLLAQFPQNLSTVSSGCRVQQTLHVTARVQVHIS